jgi:ribosomal protein L20
MKKPEVVHYLREAIKKVFIAGVRYYQKNRDNDQASRDFFRYKKGRDIEFRKFWNSNNNTSKRGFETNWKRFSNNLAEFDV